MRDDRSLPKHEPPHPRPADRNSALMRRSSPIPMATLVTSAPTRSQMLASSLMKLILVARKALLAYLTASAVVRSVHSSPGRLVGSPPTKDCWRIGSHR